MNSLCTVSQWMLKEYVLHRSIWGRGGVGGLLNVHICDQLTQHRESLFLLFKKEIVFCEVLCFTLLRVMCGEAASLPV